MNARFVKFEWENAARTIGTVYMSPEKPYSFTPGQYADFGVQVGDKILSRTMTITTLPSDPLIGFTTRFDAPHSPYKDALLNLQPTHLMTITDAMGDLVLPLDSSVPLVFVAGGVAIASYVSMIHWLTAQASKPDVTLLYAVRSAADIILTGEFDAYATAGGSLTRVLYTPDVNTPAVWPHKIGGGRIAAAEIMQHVKPQTQIYLSGTETMVEALRSSLYNDFHLPQYRLAFDYFEGYTTI